MRDLAYELRRKGRGVWYDEFSLRPGDSLRRSIDAGLAQCNFGIVVLSQAFFAKEWPQRELDALLNADIGGTKKLFPIWHGIDAKTVAHHSPLIADKIALKSSVGAEAVAESLAELIPHDPELSGDLLATAVELHLSGDAMVQNFLFDGCKFRFLQLQSYFASCQALMDEALSGMSDTEAEARADDVARGLEQRFAALARVHSLPTEAEVLRDEPLPEERIEAWVQGFEDWVTGTAGEDETATLVYDIETYFEVDYLWMLFGIPNFSVSDAQRSILSEAIIAIGCAMERDAQAELGAICGQLRALDKRSAA